MRSVDKNDPQKRPERDWEEDEDAVLSSLNKKDIVESDDGQSTDDEQVQLNTICSEGKSFVRSTFDVHKRLKLKWYVL